MVKYSKDVVNESKGECNYLRENLGQEEFAEALCGGRNTLHENLELWRSIEHAVEHYWRRVPCHQTNDIHYSNFYYLLLLFF